MYVEIDHTQGERSGAQLCLKNATIQADYARQTNLPYANSLFSCTIALLVPSSSLIHVSTPRVILLAWKTKSLTP